MFMDIILLIAGLILVLAGANLMTDGSAAIARRFGMSDFVVGLTVVSMMTSAPELVVSITGAINASSEMAIGNIVGSNIFNILVIIGIVAIIRPVKVEAGVLNNEIPLVVLSSVALFVIGLSPVLDNTPMTVTRVEGILLLLFFVIFMRYTFSTAKRHPGENAQTADNLKRPMPFVRAVIYTLAGLGALIVGGQLFVDSASEIARAIGWSEGLIGLTLLAAGTSLPELATSVVAAVKGFPGICIGNVIGSNIFNIFFVLGLTSSITPLGFGSIGMADLSVLTVASILFWLFGRVYRKRTITRAEGILMLSFYIAYIVWLYTGL